MSKSMQVGVIKFLLLQTIFTNTATNCRIKGSNLIAKATKHLCSKFYYFFGFTKTYSKTYLKKYYWQWHYTLAYLFIN